MACGGTNEIENLQPLCIECHKQKTKEENELGVYRVNDEVASTFNDTVLQQIFNTSQFKSWQFVEKVNEPVPNMNQFKIDMSKCRRNITFYSKFEYPVYSIMDIPQPFNGVVKCGLFYVVTNNVFPFRGSGWYYEPLVNYGIDHNLITTDNIKYEFTPYKTLPNNYFQKHIDILLNAFNCEPDLQKLSINAFVGLMGITTRQVCYSKYSLCPYTASAWYVSNNKDVFIKNHHLTNGETLYEGLFSEEVLNETTQYCIYSMVLQMEALELHKIETLVIDNGGIILDRNTDAIRYNLADEIDIEPYFYDDEQTVRKYKPENPAELHTEHLAHLNRLDISEKFNFTTKWNIEYGYTGSAKDKAQEIIDSKISIHIDGRAGTGKTFLVNEIIKILKKDDIVTKSLTSKGEVKKTVISNYMCFSPTNKGARLINGTTIHSVYYKFKHSKSMLFKMLEGKKYIIIDEVSMMVEKFYYLFTMIKRACPHIVFIISGDFGQLPPVKDSWVGDYENSVAMSYLCDGNRLQLTNCMRADNILFNICKNVDDFNIDDFKPKTNTYLNLAYTHETRINVNNDCMKRFLIE